MPPRTHTDIDRQVAENIRRRRLALGLTQQVIADNVGVTFQQYQKYENAQNRITIGRLVLICDTLDLAVDDVIRAPAIRASRFRIVIRSGDR